MLSKLINHEFKATRRIFLPFYGLIFALAIINAISIALDHSLESLPGGWILVAYIVAMCAIGIIAFVYMIRRFYVNLLGDEGYLMFTLPVRPSELIWSKCIVSVVWFFVSALVGILSLIIVTISISGLIRGSFWNEAGSVLFMLFEQNGVHTVFIPLVALVLAIVWMANFCMHIYACLAIGGLANNHRLGAAIGAYVVISFAWNLLVALSASISDALNLPDLNLHVSLNLNPGYVQNHYQIYLVLAICILWEAINVIANFLITNYLLSHKLNLQ